MSDPRLLVALLGDDLDRRQLYLKSPEFKQGIDTVISMLPFMVDAIAESAKRERDARELAERTLREGLPGFSRLLGERPSE